LGNEKLTGSQKAAPNVLECGSAAPLWNALHDYTKAPEHWRTQKLGGTSSSGPVWTNCPKRVGLWNSYFRNPQPLRQEQWANERREIMRTRHQKKRNVLFKAAAIFSMALLLVINGGCGTTKVSTQSNINASVGQQLMDLQKAHEQGLVSDKDYEKLREAIIKKNQ
jgi:hypothetical protein